MGESDFNLEERVLCSDGNCIGLVGADGRCKVCGRAYDGDEPLPETAAGPALDIWSAPEEAGAAQPAGASDDVLGGAAVDETDAETDVEARVCCPDDNCIGIIGVDGRCGTCGRASETTL